MDDWFSMLFNSDYGPAFIGGTNTIFFIVLMAFAVGHWIGFIYMWSHEAISYSRTFVASLAVLPALVAVMMIVMVGNLLIAFGMLAIFGMIHFRNVMKDTRDTTFVLWSVMEGATIGTMRFSTALIAAAGIGAAYLYCRLVSFGTRHRYDAVVTLRISGELLATGAMLKQLLHYHAWNARLINERRANEGGVDMAYRLLLRDPARIDELQKSLNEAEGLTNVAVFAHDDEAEI
jgi:hypothetical protein